MNGHIIVSDWTESPPYRDGSARDGGRAPDAISSQAANAGFGQGIDIAIGPTPQTGIPFSEQLALTSATAYACSRARGETLGSLPAIVYQQVSEAIRRRARGADPWHLLYSDPNPFMGAVCFYELMDMRMVNRGNAFAEIERDGADNPIALWPIHPSRVLARSERDGNRWRLYWEVMTDAKDPNGMNYIMHRIEDRNMLNVCGFGGNGIIAPGVIDKMAEEISIDLTSRQYAASFFKNGGKPTAVIEHPGYIDDDDQRREFRADMNSVLKGSENWNGVPIMWNGAKYKEIQVDPQRAQLLETRGFSALQVCRAYNVSPPIVQIFADYKAKSIDEIIMMFVKHTVRPDAIRIESEINRKVLMFRDNRGRLRNAYGNDEYFLEFLLEGLIRGDAKKQAETFEIKRRNGVMNANEWRAKDNENPLPGAQGELQLVPGGFTSLEQLAANPPEVSKPATSGGGSDNASASGQSVAFLGRERIIEAVDRAIGPRRNIVRGARVRSRPSSRLSAMQVKRNTIRMMATKQLTEAVDRINAVLESERVRLAAKGQQLMQLHWDRHLTRLESALLPGCQSYAMSSKKIDANVMACSLAMKIVGKQSSDYSSASEPSLEQMIVEASKAKEALN